MNASDAGAKRPEGTKSGAPPMPMGAKSGGPPPPPPGGVAYGKLLRWSWRVVRTALGPFALATGFALLAQTLVQYNVQLLSSIVTQLTGGGAVTKGGGDFLDRIVPTDLRTAGILLIVLLLVRVGLTFLSNMLTAVSDNLMSSRLQTWLHDRLLRLGPAYHRRHDVGSTTLVVSQFAPGSQAIFADLISFPLLRGVGLVTATVFLVGNLQKFGDTPAWVTIAFVGVLFLLPLGTWWLGNKVRGAYIEVREDQKNVQEELLNSLSQPGEVQVLGAEPQRAASFGQAVVEMVRSRIRAVLRMETVRQFQTAVPDILRAAFLAYGIAQVLRTGDASLAGPIVAIYQFVPEAVRPVQELTQFYVGIQSSWAQVQDVVEVLETEPRITDDPAAREAPSGAEPLSLDAVVYAYEPGGRPILDGLDHTFAPGGVTAIVARSGGGKSTLFNLLCRLYDPQQGSVRFGEEDLRDLRLSSYRRRVAKISQFPLFIMDTIRENFRLVDPDVTDAEIREVCERTGMWRVLEGVVSQAEDPLDYVLPRAQDQGLSGGERRLLAITRALLTEPSVLLMDEPTTGIDKLGRQMLMGIIRELGQRITIILVDHNVREFVAEVADEVCVLEDGRFTEKGKPADLASRPGLFRSLFDQEDAEGDAKGETVDAAPPGVQLKTAFKPEEGSPGLKTGGKESPPEDEGTK